MKRLIFTLATVLLMGCSDSLIPRNLIYQNGLTFHGMNPSPEAEVIYSRMTGGTKMISDPDKTVVTSLEFLISETSVSLEEFDAEILESAGLEKSESNSGSIYWYGVFLNGTLELGFDELGKLISVRYVGGDYSGDSRASQDYLTFRYEGKSPATLPMVEEEISEYFGPDYRKKMDVQIDL